MESDIGVESELGGLHNLECEVSLNCDGTITKTVPPRWNRILLLVHGSTLLPRQSKIFFIATLCRHLFSFQQTPFSLKLIGLQLLRSFFILNLDGHYLQCVAYMEKKMFANIPDRVAVYKSLTYPFYAGMFIQFILKNNTSKTRDDLTLDSYIPNISSSSSKVSVASST